MYSYTDDLFLALSVSVDQQCVSNVTPVVALIVIKLILVVWLIIASDKLDNYCLMMPCLLTSTGPDLFWVTASGVIFVEWKQDLDFSRS